MGDHPGAVTPARSPLRTWLWQVAVLAIVYHLGARVGLSMAYLQSNTSPVWPPTGIALAALLLIGISRWPGIALGVLAGSLLTGAPIALAVGMAVGNTLEAVIGAHILIRTFGFHPALDRTHDVTGLAVVAVFSTMISASLGASTLVLTGLAPAAASGSIWFTWWIGDLLGALVVAPFFLSWAQSGLAVRPGRRLLEAGAAFTLLALVTWYVFIFQSPPGVYHQALLYSIFPFVIWTAIRFGHRGGTSAVVLVSGMSIWATVADLGPFSLHSKNDNLILLQTFLGVVSLTSLLLAAMTTERLRATGALRRQAQDLSTLNESSRTFLDAPTPPAVYQTICDLAIARVGVDAAWIDREKPEGGDREVMAWSGVDRVEAERHAFRRTPSAQDGSGAGVDVYPIAASTNSVGRGAPFTEIAIVPLIFSGALIGELKLLSRESGFFTTERQLLLESYANLAAVVIQNRLLVEELRVTNRQLHGLSQRLIRAQEDERLNLSRELHDVSSQLLAGLLFELGVLERNALEPNAASIRVQGLKATAHELQENLHQLAVHLRPASLDHVGLVTALEQYLHDFGQQYNLRVEFESVGMQAQRLAHDVETAIYRVVQESLTNVILHAHATRVDVLLGWRNGNVVVTIEDDGVGFLPGTLKMEERLGLFGMRERVEMLEGNFTLETSPGKGTTVNVEIPCDA